MSRKHLRLLSAIALLAITSTSAHAQDSVWLNDFNAARQKAAAEKKPIIIDFGTVNCFWCKKLDMTTFRDPAVAKRLAEQFVAVRIDADKEAALARHLGVSSYPTLVFAAHDGRILGQHVGYVETPRFQQQLDRALSDNGKEPKAIAVAAAPVKAAPIQTAPTPIAMTPVSTTQAADERRGESPLEQIRADYAARRYMSCLERCRELTTLTPTEADAAEAQRFERSIKSDPEKLRIVQASLIESLGDVYLANAETAIREQRWQDARLLLERVQEICPASPQALAAKHQDLRLRAQVPAQPIFRMQSQ